MRLFAASKASKSIIKQTCALYKAEMISGINKLKHRMSMSWKTFRWT